MNNIKISWNITEKKGGKAWYVILSWYDSEGKRKQKSKTTGIPLKGNNKKRAKDAAKLIAEHFEAELNEHERAKSRLLFSDYMYQWLNSRKHNIRQNTYDGYKLIIDSSIKPYFDSIGAELETLTSQQIQAYYQLLFDKGLSTSTVKHHHANISSALKMAIKQRLVAYNPILGVDPPKPKKVEMSAFTLEQLNRIFDAVKGEQIQTAVYLGGYLGLRRGEILGLTWDNVDFENKIIHIRQTRTRIVRELYQNDTKTETSKRDLPLDPELEKLLLEEKKRQAANRDFFKSSYIENNLVCRYADGRKLGCDYLSKRFKEILGKLGINGHLHSLRHTVGTLMCNGGNVNIKTVSAYLGHSNLASTNIYLHSDLQAKAEAANILSKMINHRS